MESTPVKHLLELFKAWSGNSAEEITALPPSGSDRKYYRIKQSDMTCIGTYGRDLQENRAFISFSRHFLQKGISVPEIYAVSKDERCYLQEDLGDRSLLDVLKNEKEPFRTNSETLKYYRKAISGLQRMQIEGITGLDIKNKGIYESFDQRAIQWDLNYFKYYFLKPTGIIFDEALLENDFQQLSGEITAVDSDYFMFRDFQARNIFIKNEETYFIDYQGGRKGPLQYDLASLLFQSRAGLSTEVRDDLFEYYCNELSMYPQVDSGNFRKHFPLFILIRLLQVLGAYGFRGFFERKGKFLHSIPPALEILSWYLGKYPFQDRYPEIYKCLQSIIRSKEEILPEVQTEIKRNHKLLVLVSSFSYKSGIPGDTTEHGGGFVFDCRSIYNPGRKKEYRTLTGKDEEVIKFLQDSDEMKRFLGSVKQVTEPAIEKYLDREFEYMSIAFGCTGGQHRSVYSAEEIAKWIRTKYPADVRLIHREESNWPEREKDNA